MIQVSTQLLDPRVYPDYRRRQIKIPTWEMFDQNIQFTVLRIFSQKDGYLTNWRYELDLYTKQYRLGKVIWPIFQTIRAKNFFELAEEIKVRNLYLFDIWGYVPGARPRHMWTHELPPDGMINWLEQKLGENFISFGNDEQDGRYIGSYVCAQSPQHQDRVKQYLNFQRHAQRIGDDLGNRLTLLVSLCFGHYFLKEGNHTMIGAETGQALPNSQVYYSFIRGAGKQYGILWFGNASVFNRFGFKVYGDEGVRYDGRAFGPTFGTSLSLLRRLLYTHILYNCSMAGFDAGWFVGDNIEKRIENIPTPLEKDPSILQLSPIGGIQQKAVEWVEENGLPGVMHTPVAFLLDFFAGWAMPRHLYSPHSWQVWGAMPYENGDFLTHGLFDMVYPKYDDASYYHNEQGFLSRAPFGDMFDTLLSDAPDWILRRYPVIVLAGKLKINLEISDRLKSYIHNGGHLIVTAANAQMLWPEWNITGPINIQSGAEVYIGKQKTIEDHSFEMCSMDFPTEAKTIAHFNGKPLAIEVQNGAGLITVALSPFGINSEALTSDGTIAIDSSLKSPYVLLKHFRQILSDIFNGQQLFKVGEDLAHITCRKRQGLYTLGIYNNDWSEKEYQISSNCGHIEQIKEFKIDPSAKYSIGYVPQGVESIKIASNQATHIAGGDIRIFEINVQETGVKTIEQIDPPARPEKIRLVLRDIKDIKETILSIPTFFQHFDGLMIDYKYLLIRTENQIRKESEWLKQQKVEIAVDFRSGCNYYPDITLLDTLPLRYQESIRDVEDVLTKMPILSAQDAVFKFHRNGEWTNDQEAVSLYMKTFKYLANKTETTNLRLHLQPHPSAMSQLQTAEGVLKIIRDMDCPKIKLALSTDYRNEDCLFLFEHGRSNKDLLGMILISSSLQDRFSQFYDAHQPFYHSWINGEKCMNMNTLLFLDGVYNNWDEIYLDLKKLKGH